MAGQLGHKNVSRLWLNILTGSYAQVMGGYCTPVGLLIVVLSPSAGGEKLPRSPPIGRRRTYYKIIQSQSRSSYLCNVDGY